jgi:hypothetical protein
LNPPDTDGSQGESTQGNVPAAGIEVYKAIRSHEIMLNQATSTYEHATVAPLILVNGGAAVAYLTLAGALSRNGSGLALPAVWAVTAIASWGFGLIFAQLMVGYGLKEQRSWARRERMNRQRYEWVLLENLQDLRAIVAPNDVAPEKIKEEGVIAKQARKRKAAMRYASMAAFGAGLLLAAVSLS